MHDAVRAAYHRIRPHVRETPVDESPAIAEGGAATVYLKLEFVQHTGSFKFRGASNKIALLTPHQAAAGVVAASNGNHGLAVAAAARARGIAAEVFVSSQVSPARRCARPATILSPRSWLRAVRRKTRAASSFRLITIAM